MSATRISATKVVLRVNPELFQHAVHAAKSSGVPVKQFLSEVIECAIADRRCRELPPEPVSDPVEKFVRRPRGVGPKNLHGAREEPGSPDL